MTTATKPTKRPSAKAEIKATVAEVRAANAAAHEERLENCTTAAEGAPVQKIPAGVSGLKGKAKKLDAPLTEDEAAKAADAWIDAKDGRRDRYGVAEATSCIFDGTCTITTTNFAMIEVDVTTGKAKFAGWSPNKPQVLKLTWPAKMGAAKKPRTAKAQKEALAIRRTRRAGKFEWSSLPVGIETEKADAYAEMMLSGAGVTPRHVETTLGLNARQRDQIDRAMYGMGYKLHRKANPDRDSSDRLTANLYWSEVRSPAS